VLSATEIYNDAFSKGFKPDPRVDFVDWANEKMQLTSESSVEPGKYRTSRTPWVEEILRELSPQSATQEVVVIKPTQMAFTTIANIVLFATADLYPGPCLMAMPTDAMAIKHSKKKIAASLKMIPCLKNKVREAKSRDSGNTILLKEFPGGSWTFTGSNSPTSARSDSVKIVILDDLDGFVQDMGGEGDYTLFQNRADAFGTRKKIYKNSTPTNTETSHITKEFKSSSQGHYSVACPRCGKYQYLIFGGKESDFGLKFKHNDSNEVTEVYYVCQHCGGRIEEYQKTDLFKTAKYIHKHPDRKKRGFKINSLYSPLGWVSWAQVAEEFLAAGKNQRKLKRWTNTRMAEPFEEKGARPDWQLLKSRCEPYQPLTVPEGGLFLTAGVDTQDNRLALVVKAWGLGEESFVVYYTELFGDPGQAAVWDQLDTMLSMPYKHALGPELYISSTAIDTGGHHTHDVYNYVRRKGNRVIAIKGASTPGKPVLGRPTLQDVNFRGTVIKSGIQLWPVGTDIAKGIIYNRLNLTLDGDGSTPPGYVHFYIGLNDDYFSQLTAEKLITQYDKNGYPQKKWVVVTEDKRNEAIDCEVYAYAAAIHSGIARMNWDSLEQMIRGGMKKAEPAQRKTARPVVRSKFLS